MSQPSDIGVTRLDAFVDAAFAFAITLLVIGGSAAPESYAELRAAVRRIPAFLIGFALVAMFWHGHVRWRRYGGSRSILSVFLSFALVFLVLIYVYPLRLMAVSLIDWIMRTPGVTVSRGELGQLFTIYGVGFALMSATMLMLFADGRRGATGEDRTGLTGEIGIWAMLVTAGTVSAVIGQIPAVAPFAAFAYAPLGLLVPVYAVWFWNRPQR